MIEARNLVKGYGSTMAVNDLSFSIRPGLVGGLRSQLGASRLLPGIRVDTSAAGREVRLAGPADAPSVSGFSSQEGKLSKRRKLAGCCGPSW
jgi:ABC-type phosphonate transport system ATPase subunit